MAPKLIARPEHIDKVRRPCNIRGIIGIHPVNNKTGAGDILFILPAASLPAVFHHEKL